MNLWMAVGFAGQVLFASRFLVQILASERQRRSLIPLSFWYLSIAGAVLLLAYAISIRDPVFILGQSTGFLIYLRNLWLIRNETTMVDADAQ